jgi:phage terminase large subunit-like protein
LNVLPQWTTACPDWEQRLLSRRSLVPFDPLFPDEAEAALAIFRELRIVDAPGSPTIGQACLPWAFDLPRHLFGAYDAQTGRRLIQFFMLFVAKKNAKSTMAAAVMLTALMRNWRRSGEFLILAPTREIADNSFIPARDMVREHPHLRQILRIREDKRIIQHQGTQATLKIVAADSETVGGKKTIGLLIDELWLLGKRANADAMIREAAGGLASRPEGFVIYSTTQSDTPPQGVFAQKLEEFRAIRDGKIQDPRSLGILYEFPERMIMSGEYRDPRNFYVPNPNLGASVDEPYVIDQAEKAERAGKSSVINFEAKHLNVQVGMSQRADGWAGAEIWNRGSEPGLTLDAILERSEVVTVGIDGGGLDDLLGIGVIGREKKTKRWLCWAHALISDIGLERRKANRELYDQFERDGDLAKFEYSSPVQGEDQGIAWNIRYVVDLVRRVKDAGLLAQVGVDAAGIGAIVDALGEIGVTQDAEKLDAVRQGIGLMNAIKTCEIKLADYSFRHGNSALLAWCAGNLRVVPTPTAMRVARDESGYGKVDPLMACFNAAHLMGLNPTIARVPQYQMLVLA